MRVGLQMLLFTSVSLKKITLDTIQTKKKWCTLWWAKSNYISVLSLYSHHQTNPFSTAVISAHIAAFQQWGMTTAQNWKSWTRKVNCIWASTCEVLKRRVSHPNIEPSVVCFIFLTVSWPEQRPSYLQVVFSLSWARFYCEKQNETGWSALLHLGIPRR